MIKDDGLGDTMVSPDMCKEQKRKVLCGTGISARYQMAHFGESVYNHEDGIKSRIFWQASNEVNGYVFSWSFWEF